MEHDIYVISLVSTGLQGYPTDEVVEVAICGVDTERGDIESVYSSTVKIPSEHWTEERRRFVMERHGLGREELEAGRDPDEVSREVREILSGKTVTSFDIRREFYGHLLYEPWDLTGEATIAPSIKIRSEEICRIPFHLRRDGNVLEITYNSMLPSDPALVDGGHRALDDALRASSILLELSRSGHY